MNDKKTPIPLRASRKKAEPIMFPRPILSQGSNTTPVDTNLNPIDTPLYAGGVDVAELRNLVAKWVAQAIYKTAMRMTEAAIIEMGEAQFEVLIRSILEDNE